MVLSLALAMLGLVAPTPAPLAYAALSSIRIDGHGWGHGRGLGQWGAYGYAVDHGWTSAQILDHFYGGTVASNTPNTDISVRLTAMNGADLLVTSGADFTIGGVRISGGSAGRLTRRPDGRYELFTRYGCGQPDAWYAGIVQPQAISAFADPGNDVGKMLQVCQPDGAVRAYRGTLRLTYSDGQQRSVNTLPLEQYLRGVVPREVPASWGDAAGGRGMQALQAQSVAARSYARAEGGEGGQRFPDAKTCDSTTCQVYGGAGLNGARIEDPRTDAAIAQTAGLVRRFPSGALARTEFSASTGGYTAGGDFPAVPDEGDTRSPYHSWSTTVSGQQLSAAFGVGVVQDVTVTARNGLGSGGGRATQVKITGSSGSVTVTGAQFRTALGLRSDWFFLTPVQEPATEWHQRNSLTTGTADNSFRFGPPQAQGVACDWRGTGVDTPGTFNDGAWAIRLANATGPTDIDLAYGSPGDIPLCGDWDGDGVVGIGVYRPSTYTFYLRNTVSTGVADVSISFGNRGDRPVVGDWDGDGSTSIGVFRPSNVTFYLSNSLSSGRADGEIPFGNSTDTPVTGSWNGGRFTTIGVYRPGTFYLKTSNFPGPTDLVVGFGGWGDRPVVGDWDGDNVTEPGIIRPPS